MNLKSKSNIVKDKMSIVTDLVISGVILALLNYLFDRYYCRKRVFMRVFNAKHWFVTGISGGSGKTTFATALSKRLNLLHIRIDNCKYGPQELATASSKALGLNNFNPRGPHWVRYSPEQFKQNLIQEMERGDNEYNGWVVEGLFSDPTGTDVEKENLSNIMKHIVNESDVLIRFRLPLWITVYRKVFRSLKRAFGLAPQGAAPEKWHNVKRMIRKTIAFYEDNKQHLDNEWENMDKIKLTYNWPNYPIVE